MQPVPVCFAGGDITAYTVFYRVADDELSHDKQLRLSSWQNYTLQGSESTSAPLNLLPSEDYEVVVHARTSHGFNYSLKSVPVKIVRNTLECKNCQVGDSCIAINLCVSITV
jgi:Fibronectin type III domain